MSRPEPAWNVGTQDEFVLEDDENFGVGQLEGVDAPPFDAGQPAPGGQEAADEPLVTTMRSGDTATPCRSW